MRIALFGTGGSISQRAFETLRVEHEIAAVVVPGVLGRPAPWRVRRMLRRWRAARALRVQARRRGIPVLTYRRGRHAALVRALQAYAPDVACVAAFPFLLPPAVLAVPRHGAINLHTSALPRHRGPDPLFWTYFDDDTHAGVTVHWLDAGMDSGPILAQEILPLARGRARRDLLQELTARGVRLLAAGVHAIAAGTAPRIAQDGAQATQQPLPRRGRWAIDFARWPAERVWHFLAGLGETLEPPLPGVADPGVIHGAPRGFRVTAHERLPGAIERHGDGWRLYCRDGFVDLAAAASRRSRVRAALRRLAGG